MAARLSLEAFTPFDARVDGWDGSLRATFVSFWNSARGLRHQVWMGALGVILAGTGSLIGLEPAQWPVPAVRAATFEDADDALVRAQPVCVINTQQSAGELGTSVVVRHRRDGDRLWVSYFVYWSSERPWGDKPWFMSLAIDAFYSHFLFVLPGIRHALYGPGDVEGVTVVYRDVGGRLEVIEGYGDDEYHRSVRLDREDLHGADDHTMLMTTTWSHQLGGHGAAEHGRVPGASQRCFSGAELVPLTRDIAERFWLGSASAPRRARRAWL